MYAPNIKNSRKNVWDSLSIIRSKYYYGRWIFLGDFNVPLYDHEKKGEMCVRWMGDWILLIKRV